MVSAVILMALLATGILLANLEVFQRMVWDRIVQAVSSETDWQLDAESARFRLVPGSVLIRGLTVETGEGRPISVDAIEIGFHWRRLMATPRFIDRVVVDGLSVDLNKLELPDRDPPTRKPGDVDPWRTLEIGEIRLTNSRLVAAPAGVGAALEGLRIAGALQDGRAAVEMDAESLVLERDDRLLHVGKVAISARAGESGVTVDHCEIEGSAVRLAGSGDLGGSPAVRGGGSVEGEFELGSLIRWWDPHWESKVSPSGRLAVGASIAYDPELGLEVDLDQHGSPVAIAGFPVTGLAVEHSGGVTRGGIDIAGHGRLEVESGDDGRFQLAADIADLEAGRILAVLNRPEMANLPAGLTVDGDIQASFVVPLSPVDVVGEGQILLRWPTGRIEVDAAGGGLEWRVRRLELELPGTFGTGHGMLSDGSLIAGVHIDIEDPQRLAPELTRWVPQIEGLAAGGDPFGSN